ncbi:hypothetical protein V8E36_009419 [Tilletia maclaganii]
MAQEKRMTRAYRSRLINVMEDGTMFTQSQGGSAYIDFSNGTSVAIAQGFLRRELNNDPSDQQQLGEPRRAPASIPPQVMTVALQPAAPPPPPASSESHGAGPLSRLSTNPYAFDHIERRHAFSNAARCAVEGRPSDGALATWCLEDVIVFDPSSPPSTLKKTQGSKTAFKLQDGKHVKETWRCIKCGALRNVDPRVTTALTAHFRKCSAKDNENLSP